MTQAALAEKVGVVVSTVCEWEDESKDGCNPRVEKLPVIAKALGITVEELVA